MKRKINWIDLPAPKGFFTSRSTGMINLDINKPIQYYSANTKINVVQYAIVADKIYFRTASAKSRDLNWAIGSSSFKLPNEYLASLAPNILPMEKSKAKEISFSLKENKQPKKEVASPKSEGETKPQGFLKRLFRKKN